MITLENYKKGRYFATRLFSFLKVRELAETLERSLSFGSSTKKPAGGVSLHFQGSGNERSEPQRSTAQQSSGRQVKSMRC